MTMHLDTNFLIQALARGTPQNRTVAAWMAGSVALAVSSVAWSEFMCGPLEASHPHDALAMLGEPLAFARPEAELAARLYNLAGRRRGSMADCQIAAVAIHAGARLATADRRGFAVFQPAGLLFAD